MPTIAEVATVLSTVSQYGWPAIVLLTLVLLGRTRPCQDLMWVLSTEIRYQYLKRRGFTDKQLATWVRQREKASSSESTSSPTALPARSSSSSTEPQKDGS
ncbi:hypothetical protein [Actinomycetospora atypica]|uniref:Uncharacterized protein n=1 Tax=Actinomycetospora atypica TaxID=1290095 RepID=A0ABV9YVW3_9PSEU